MAHVATLRLPAISGSRMKSYQTVLSPPHFNPSPFFTLACSHLLADQKQCMVVWYNYCRKGYYWVSWDWLGEDCSILLTNITSSTGKTKGRKVIRTYFNSNQVLYELVALPRSHWLCDFRELAFQIGEQVAALGGGIGVRSAVVVGGIDMMTQAYTLFKKPSPHIVVGKYAWLHCTYQVRGLADPMTVRVCTRLVGRSHDCV